MARHQLGLGLDRVGEAGLQHLGHLLVILLPRALQQGGIRRILHQGMLKDIWHAADAPLVEQLGVDQLRQPLLQQRFLHAGQGAQHLVGNSRPRTAPSWATSRIIGRRSSRAIKESWSVVGIRTADNGLVSV